MFETEYHCYLYFCGDDNRGLESFRFRMIASRGRIKTDVMNYQSKLHEAIYHDYSTPKPRGGSCGPMWGTVDRVSLFDYR
jgi:hypothetical protein